MARVTTAIQARGGISARPRVAVISGGDAQRTQSATSAEAISEALFALGREPVAVATGVRVAEDLLATEAPTAVNAVLDSHAGSGEIEELCRLLDITCLGGAAVACRTTADRAICSSLLSQAGVAVPAQMAFSRSSTFKLGIGAALPVIAAVLGPGVLVKPRHGIAGLGVRVVEDERLIPHAIESAFVHDGEVVIESIVRGREYTVLVSGGRSEEPWAVGVAEVRYGEGNDPAASTAWVRSFSAVGDAGASELQTVTAAARRAARVLACDGLVTVDLILDERGTAWIFDVDCAVDWTPGGRVTACLETNEISERDLMASLLAQARPSLRHVA